MWQFDRHKNVFRVKIHEKSKHHGFKNSLTNRGKNDRLYIKIKRTNGFEKIGAMQIMFSKEVQVTNQVGLYARPATFFIQKANEYKSTILVEKEERRVNAKSLLGILSLGITKGTNINLIADGPDEEEAVSALIELITSNFTD